MGKGSGLVNLGISFTARLARLSAFLYYRMRYVGGEVPATGPVLLVANHPNSLLDPILVMATARRQVRFLAKSPLFDDPKVSWLVRIGGAIPVFRAHDDPASMERNVDMFRAVHSALAAGDAVGIFPEGISHSAASLAPLKTGAARIALGASLVTGGSFPVVPVGLVFRQKDVFRSQAMVHVGESIAWEDLAARGADDVDAVRELTYRIRVALRQQTVNLAAWQDREVVETAVRIWEVEHDAVPDPAERLRRLAETARVLAEVRASDDDEGNALAAEVTAFDRRLTRVGLQPADLRADISARRGLRWAIARLPLILPLWATLAVAGWLLFLVPYHLTGLIVDRFTLEADTRSTWKAMIGGGLYLVWVLLLVAAAFTVGNGFWALATFVGVPLVGMAGLLIREQWAGAWADARRFALLRSRSRLLAALRERQQGLGHRLDALRQRHSSETSP